MRPKRGSSRAPTWTRDASRHARSNPFHPRSGAGFCRDGGCCRVPGCRLATFLDVHHLRLCSEGGKNTLENLITLCGAHHTALHRGKLLTEGTASRGLT